MKRKSEVKGNELVSATKTNNEGCTRIYSEQE